MGKKGRKKHKAGKKAHERWQKELRESLSAKQTSQISRIDSIFRDNNPLNTNNCYCKAKILSNATFITGFKYKDKVFILNEYKKSSIISISCTQKYSLTITSFVSVDRGSIVKCGNNDTKIVEEIEFRLSLFKKCLNSDNAYVSYFKFLYKNRENDLIAPYFQKLFNAEKNEYAECFSTTVKNTLRYFKNPSLLVSIQKTNNISNQQIPIYQSSKYQFTEYRDTKGIYYTLSDESVILSDENVDQFNIKYLKKFAYIAGDKLSKYFSFMTATFNPEKQNLSFRWHNGKWNELAIPIKIDQYDVRLETLLSGLSKIMWNISVQIAKRLYLAENHTSISYKTNSNSVNHKQSYKNNTAFLKPSTSARNNCNNDIIVLAHKDLEKKLTERKMHYRKGHWHYYWYGAYNSPERHKELKWVEETIVNRDSVNIVIVI